MMRAVKGKPRNSHPTFGEYYTHQLDSQFNCVRLPSNLVKYADNPSSKNFSCVTKYIQGCRSSPLRFLMLLARSLIRFNPVHIKMILTDLNALRALITLSRTTTDDSVLLSTSIKARHAISKCSRRKVILKIRLISRILSFMASNAISTKFPLVDVV